MPSATPGPACRPERRRFRSPSDRGSARPLRGSPISAIPTFCGCTIFAIGSLVPGGCRAGRIEGVHAAADGLDPERTTGGTRRISGPARGGHGAHRFERLLAPLPRRANGASGIGTRPGSPGAAHSPAASTRRVVSAGAMSASDWELRDVVHFFSADARARREGARDESAGAAGSGPALSGGAGGWRGMSRTAGSRKSGRSGVRLRTLARTGWLRGADGGGRRRSRCGTPEREEALRFWMDAGSGSRAGFGRFRLIFNGSAVPGDSVAPHTCTAPCSLDIE